MKNHHYKRVADFVQKHAVGPVEISGADIIAAIDADADFLADADFWRDIGFIVATRGPQTIFSSYR